MWTTTFVLAGCIIVLGALAMLGTDSYKRPVTAVLMYLILRSSRPPASPRCRTCRLIPRLTPSHSVWRGPAGSPGRAATQSATIRATSS